VQAQSAVRRSAAAPAPLSRAASGTPLSSLDPPGYPTVEATYAKMAKTLTTVRKTLKNKPLTLAEKIVRLLRARACHFSRRPPPLRRCSSCLV
jgi:hypothetical protein